MNNSSIGGLPQVDSRANINALGVLTVTIHDHSRTFSVQEVDQFYQPKNALEILSKIAQLFNMPCASFDHERSSHQYRTLNSQDVHSLLLQTAKQCKKICKLHAFKYDEAREAFQKIKQASHIDLVKFPRDVQMLINAHMPIQTLLEMTNTKDQAVLADLRRPLLCIFDIARKLGFTGHDPFAARAFLVEMLEQLEFFKDPYLQDYICYESDGTIDLLGTMEELKACEEDILEKLCTHRLKRNLVYYSKFNALFNYLLKYPPQISANRPVKTSRELRDAYRAKDLACFKLLLLLKRDPNKAALFLNAIDDNRVDFLDALVKAGGPLEGFPGNTPHMIRAVEKNCPDVVAYLLQKGVHHHNEAALETAIIHKFEKVALLLIAAIPDPNQSVNPHGHTFLHLAAVQEMADCVRALLSKQGINPNTTNGAGQTPLWNVAEENKKQIAIIFLNHGVDATIRDVTGRTPFDIAAERGHLGLALEILKRGWPHCLHPNFSQNYPLHYLVLEAIITNNIQKISDYLHKNPRADINETDLWDQTALHWVAASGNTQFGGLIVGANHRIDFGKKNATNQTAFDIAIQEGHTLFLKLLFKQKGVDRKSLGNNLTELLCHAIEADNLDLVRFLLKRINPNKPDNRGQFPLRYVQSVEVATLLLKGINNRHKAELSKVPGILCCVPDDADLVQVLIKLGAALESKDGSALWSALASKQWRKAHTLLLAGAQLHVSADKIGHIFGADNTVSERIKMMIAHVLTNGSNECLEAFLGRNRANIFAHWPITNQLANLIDVVVQPHRPLTTFPIFFDILANNLAEQILTPKPLVSFDELLAAIHSESKIEEIPLSSLWCLLAHMETPEQLSKMQDQIDDRVRMRLSNDVDNENLQLIHSLVQASRCPKLFNLLFRRRQWYADGNQWETTKFSDWLVEVRTSLNGNKQFSMIHEAAQEGEWTTVRFLIQHGIPVDLTCDQGFTPLHYATCTGRMNTVKLLLKAGANANYQAKDGSTPLHSVINFIHDDSFSTMRSKKYPEVLKRIIDLLLTHGADLEAQDIAGYTPLHSAAEKGNLPVLQELISLQANVKTSNAVGMTPIHEAVIRKDLILLQLLCKHVDKDYVRMLIAERELLHYAAMTQKFEVMLFLLNFYDSHCVISQEGAYPLHCALWNYAKQHRTPFEVMFYAHKDDRLSWASTYFRRTPRDTIIHLLGREGREQLNHRDANGRTALHIAAQDANEATVELLLEKGADLNAVDGLGETPLFYAVRGHANIDVFLLKGASVHAINSEGRTPLFYAVFDENIVKRLLLANARLDIVDQMGFTLLRHCIANDAPLQIADILLKKAAQLQAGPNKTLSQWWLDEQGVNGRTVLEMVCFEMDEKKGLKWIPFLLAQGAQWDSRRHAGKSLMHILVGMKKLDLVDQIPDDNNIIDENGRTLAHEAAEAGHVEAFEFFNGSVDIRSADHRGETPIAVAIRKGHLPVVEWLIKQGVAWDPQSQGGRTITHLAAHYGHTALLRACIANQWGNVDDRDEEGNAPIHLATLAGYKGACIVLMNECNANINLTNAREFTCLDLILDRLRRDNFVSMSNAEIELVEALIGRGVHSRFTQLWNMRARQSIVPPIPSNVLPVTLVLPNDPPRPEPIPKQSDKPTQSVSQTEREFEPGFLFTYGNDNYIIRLTPGTESFCGAHALLGQLRGNVMRTHYTRADIANRIQNILHRQDATGVKAREQYNQWLMGDLYDQWLKNYPKMDKVLREQLHSIFQQFHQRFDGQGRDASNQDVIDRGTQCLNIYLQSIQNEYYMFTMHDIYLLAIVYGTPRPNILTQEHYDATIQSAQGPDDDDQTDRRLIFHHDRGHWSYCERLNRR